MIETLIAAIGALCAQYCDTDSFLSLRLANKHWRYFVFSQKSAFTHFKLNAKWQRRMPKLIQTGKVLLGKSIWNHLCSITYSVTSSRDLYILINFPNLRQADLEYKGDGNISLSGDMLPTSLRKLILRVPRPQSIQSHWWTRPSFLCLITLELSFSNSIGSAEMRALKDVICQFPTLKNLSLEFLGSVSGFPYTSFTSAFNSTLCELESFTLNLVLKPEEIITLQATLPRHCELTIWGPNDESWFKQIKTYLKSDHCGAKTIKCLTQTNDFTKYQLVLNVRSPRQNL